MAGGHQYIGQLGYSGAREPDLGLLLVTPITSKYYIWASCAVVSFMLPFAAVPTLTIILVILYDIFAGKIFNNPVVFPETIIELPLFLTVMMAWACMLGCS